MYNDMSLPTHDPTKFKLPNTIPVAQKLKDSPTLRNSSHAPLPHPIPSSNLASLPPTLQRTTPKPYQNSGIGHSNKHVPIHSPPIPKSPSRSVFVVSPLARPSRFQPACTFRRSHVTPPNLGVYKSFARLAQRLLFCICDSSLFEIILISFHGLEVSWMFRYVLFCFSFFSKGHEC
jgi:hypothetical protein